MTQAIEIMAMAGALARHAEARHQVIARNIANADTPGFRAQDMRRFSETYQSGVSDLVPHATRRAHFTGPIGLSSAPQTVDTSDPASPNGNSVSLETEMIRAAETRHQHDLALTVYRKSMDILRLSLGR